MNPIRSFNPELDLSFERLVDVPVGLVWAAWTTPEHLMQWFCPKPWSVSECKIDLRPGGLFRTVMRSPEGDLHPSDGCYLEVVPERRLVWTDALGPGFRPNAKAFMTGMIELEDRGEQTLYRATAFHADPTTRDQHQQMGFELGWGTALDQLVALVKTW